MIFIGPGTVFKMTLLTSVFSLIVERMGVLRNVMWMDNGENVSC